MEVPHFHCVSYVGIEHSGLYRHGSVLWYRDILEYHRLDGAPTPLVLPSYFSAPSAAPAGIIQVR